MKLGLVTDSTADLPQSLVEAHGIAVVPAILVLEGKSYADGEGISREAFYTRLPQMNEAPSTAAPSVGEFSERFKQLISAGCEHVLSIHAAHQLTNIGDDVLKMIYCYGPAGDVAHWKQELSGTLPRAGIDVPPLPEGAQPQCTDPPEDATN